MPNIYVVMNRHRIAANRKRPHEEREPVVRVTRGKFGKPVYCDAITFTGASQLLNGLGAPVLPCGATIALVTSAPVIIVTGKRTDVVNP